MARLAAGVRKKANGFEKRFTIEKKRYSICAGTLKELEQKEIEVREQIKQGTYTNNRDLTLDKYFDEWVIERRKTVKPTTLMKYSCYYKKHISKALGKRKIKDIEKREIQALQSSLNENPKLSISTVNLIMKVLKIILNDCVKDEIILRSPAAYVKQIKNDAKATESIHRALSRQEQADFVEEIKNDYYGDFLEFLLYTGLRQGEAAALTWRDIDFKKNVIHITKTVTYTEDGKVAIGTPKTKAGKRDIGISDATKIVLERYKEKMISLNDSDIIPFNSINNNVFHTPYGHIITSQQANRAIKGCLKRLADKGIVIEHFTAHGLRDTYATRFIEEGGSPQVLKVILGHESFSMTMDKYAQVLFEKIQEETTRIKISV